MKLALGASRIRLVLQLTSELGWIVAAGSIGAILLAAGGLKALPALSLPGGVDLSRLDLSIDWRVALAGVGAVLSTLLLAALLPIHRFTRADLARDLVSANTTGVASSHRIRRVLLGVHVAATLVVLVAAGLFVQTVVYGFTRAPGFDVDHTTGMSLFNPSIYVGAAVLMTGCAAAAGYLAAWRVQRISPANALRAE